MKKLVMSNIMTNQITLIMILVISSLLHGCAQQPKIRIVEYAPPEKPTNIPSLNVIEVAELGDTLIAQGTLKEFQTIRLLSPVTYKNVLQASASGNESSYYVSTIPEGRLVKKATIKKINGIDSSYVAKTIGALYVAEKLTVIKKTSNGKSEVINNLLGGLALPENNDDLPAICIWSNVLLSDIDLTEDCEILSSKIQYEHSTKSDWVEGSFLQELIYNGRTGDQVKFIYREFDEGMARSAFTQEVTYDLAIGDVIGFKGARFRILKANNVSIQYEVIKHF